MGWRTRLAIFGDTNLPSRAVRVRMARVRSRGDGNSDDDSNSDGDDNSDGDSDDDGNSDGNSDGDGRVMMPNRCTTTPSLEN